ncbi:MAG: glycosyltransferase [Gemmatimonadota bacterium]|nr:glycosyltransferase [Gemmatimonadota bacterium]
MPELTVIIPTNRPPATLAPCLQALTKQRMAPARFEVLVINDGALHNLAPLAEIFRTAGLQVRVIEVPRGGPGPARNRGAAEAAGALLVFTDDDCQPEPSWLEAMLAASQHHPNALLGGNVVNRLKHRPASEASQLLVSFLYRWYNRDPFDARFFASNNMAARRDQFLARGGFDPRFTLSAGEDRELCARWREDGGRLVYVPTARIGHTHDLSVTQFWRQHFKYGRGAAMYWAVRGSVHQHGSSDGEIAVRAPDGRAEVVVESPAFYWHLLCYPLRTVRWPRALTVTVLVALSQLANALGYVTTARHWPRLRSTQRRSRSELLR